jgi:hypothetical protein
MSVEQAKQAENQPASESRALVALVAPAPATPLLRYRPAPFLAHLIATKQQLPQTRERRRAEPAQAVTAYRAMAELAKWG